MKLRTRSAFAALMFAAATTPASPALAAPRAASVPVAGTPLPFTPVGRAVAVWLSAYQQGDAAELRRVVVERFAPDALAASPAADIAARDAGRRLDLGPIEIVAIEASTDSTLRARVRYPMVGAWGTLTATVEPDAPHRLLTLEYSSFDRAAAALDPDRSEVVMRAILRWAIFGA